MWIVELTGANAYIEGVQRRYLGVMASLCRHKQTCFEIIEDEIRESEIIQCYLSHFRQGLVSCVLKWIHGRMESVQVTYASDIRQNDCVG